MAITADKIKTAVEDEVREVAQLGKQAAVAGTYIYPIQGITHFVSHTSLQKPIYGHLLQTLLLSVVIIVSLFVVAYVPLVAILVWVDGPIALLNTIILLLSTSSSIILGISKWWWLDEATVEVFDAVLVEKNLQNLVAQGRELKSSSSRDPLSKLGRTIKKPFTGESIIQSVVRYVMMLPLNFIPIIGTIVFITLQARTYGPAHHARYYQLKGFSASERKSFIKENQGAYLSYGIVCVALNLIPLANIFFAFTNTVGAALWAANIETKNKQGLKKAE